MSCHDIRRLLDDPAKASSPPVKAHLEQCASCATLASRMETVRGALSRRHAGVTPGPQFAARVTANLPQGTDEPIGWAALRLLPGTLILVLLLSWLTWRNDALRVADPAPAPTQDLLNWVAAHSPETP